MASDADTDRRILAYLDGKNSSAALTITDEQIALSLVLGLGDVRNSLSVMGATVGRNAREDRRA